MMNNGEQNKFILFAENTQAVKKEFRWHDALTKRLAALLYAIENKPVDCKAIRESYNLIKNNVGIFSVFRGNMSLCIAAMLSLKDNRQKIFSDMLTIYDMMRKAKFRASDYTAVASYQIAAYAERDKVQETINRTKEFYDGMKANRRLHTGQAGRLYFRGNARFIGHRSKIRRRKN